MNTVCSEERRSQTADVLGPLSDEADQTLVKGVQAGNADAFDALFRRYGPRVLRQALHLLGSEAEAEEVAQEVFLALYEKASTFRGDARLSTWLYRLTANAALSRLRRLKRRPAVSLNEYLPQFQADGHHRVRPIVDWSQDLERRYAIEELRHMLHEALEGLQPLDKVVVVLSDLEELSNRDISEVLGLSVSAVKARLHRARLYLRGKLAISLL